MANFIKLNIVSDLYNTDWNYVDANYTKILTENGSVNPNYYCAAALTDVYYGGVRAGYYGTQYSVAFYFLSREPTIISTRSRNGSQNIHNLTLNSTYNIYTYLFRDYPPYLYVIEPPIFDTPDLLFAAFSNYNDNKQIIYVPVNCQLSGPSEASSGDDVSVLVTPNDGYVIKNPTQGANITVYNKDGYIPFTYSNNQINFTMP